MSAERAVNTALPNVFRRFVQPLLDHATLCRCIFVILKLLTLTNCDDAAGSLKLQTVPSLNTRATADTGRNDEFCRCPCSYCHASTTG